MPKKFYIKERVNPQLSNSYFVACGQLTIKKAKRIESTSYGHNYMIPYDTLNDYNAAIIDLKSNGRIVMS